MSTGTTVRPASASRLIQPAVRQPCSNDEPKPCTRSTGSVRIAVIVTPDVLCVRMARTPFGWPYKWIVAAVFVCGLFMDIMDTTIVNVALPTLQREFNTNTAGVEWVVLGYRL